MFFRKLRIGRALSARRTFGIADGRWKRRRCSDRTGGMSPADGAERTRTAEGEEPPLNEEGVPEAWRAAWIFVEETRIRWGGKFE